MISLLSIILILVLINAFGAFIPTYRTGRYYGPSWGGILLIIVILYFMGYR